MDPRDGPARNMAAVPTARNLWYLLIMSRDVEHVVEEDYECMHTYKYVDDLNVRGNV